MTDQNPTKLTAPWVKVFYCTRTQARITPEVINLSDAHCTEKIAGREDPAHWNFQDLNELWTGIKLPLEPRHPPAPAATATATA